MALTNSVGRSVISTHGALAARGFDADFIPTYNKALGQLWTSFNPVFDKLSSSGRVKSKKPSGKWIEFPVELKLTGGATPSGEGDTLPTIDPAIMVVGKVDYQRGIKGRFGISEESFEWGKANAGTFADVMEQETRILMGDIENIEGIAIHGNGDGQLAYCGSLSGSASMTVTSAETNAACTPGTRWLYEGMRLQAINVASNIPTTDSSWTNTTTTNQVAAITSDTAVTLGAANTLNAASYLTTPLSYTSGVASSSRWPMGLLNIVDDGTFSDNAGFVVDPAFGCCGLPVASYPQWKSTVSANSGILRALTMDLLYQIYFKMTKRAGKMKLNVGCVMNTDVYREYVALHEPNFQYQARKLNGGFEEFDIMIYGTPISILLDHKCPSYIYFLDYDNIDFYNSRPLGIVAPDGMKSIIGAQTMSREYRYWHAWQLATTKRSAHAVIRDISKTITAF
jgi:hypothetical protein